MKAKLVKLTEAQFKEIMSGIMGGKTDNVQDEALKEILKNAPKDLFDNIKSVMEDRSKEADEAAERCAAIDKLLKAMGASKSGRITALSLVLRRDTKEHENSLADSMREFDQCTELIATVSQLYNLKTKEEVIGLLSSTISALAVIGDELIEKANRNVTIHKNVASGCETCTETDCSEKANCSSEESKLGKTDEIISKILNSINK